MQDRRFIPSGQKHNGLYKKDGPGPFLMGAGTLLGNEVHNAAGERIGSILEVMLDMYTGRISYAVLAHAVVNSNRVKLFAVPWSALTLDTGNKCFALNVTNEHLKQAPGFDSDNWPDMADQGWDARNHKR